jgi:hypothetical protein
MKHLILIIIASSTFFITKKSYAEDYIHKGLKQFDFEFFSSRSEKTSNFSYSVGGAYGKFLTDKVIVGLSSRLFGRVGNVVSNASISPFARYYFYKTFFGAAAISYNRAWSSGSSPNFWTYNYELTSGYNYFITKNLALTPSFTFTHNIDYSRSANIRLGETGAFYLQTSFSYFF